MIEKFKKKIIALFMAGAVLITGGALPQEKVVAAAEGKDYGISNPRAEDGVTTWDKIKFGSYYQDAEFEPEPIKWRVLSVDGDDAFLMQDETSDAVQFYADDITAVPGSDVEIPIRIKNNTGIMGLGIRFEFDKNTVTPVDNVEHTSLIAGQFNNSIESALRDKTDSFKVLWQGTDEMKQDGLLFTLKFHIASDADGDTDIRLTLLEDETFDEQYENVSVACNDVRIKIENNIPDNPTATPKPTNTPTPTTNPDVTQTPDTTEQPSATQNPGTQGSAMQPPQNSDGDNDNLTEVPDDATELTAPAKLKLKSVKAAGKKKLIIRWKWVSGQGGFQVQYALNRGFSKGKKDVNVSKDAAEKIINKLKSKKKYYVRVRAYKMIYGIKVYGKWSNVKKCKVK